MKRWMLTVIAIGALTLAARPAEAAYIIDFGRGNGTQGSYTCSGGNCQTTVGVALGTLQFSADDGATWSVYDTTGTGTSADGNGAAVMTFNTATGNLVVTGGVVGLAGLSGTGNILLSGSFTSFTAGSAFLGFGGDFKNATLLADLNAPNLPYTFRLNLFGSGGGPTYNVTSTDLENTPVPEPGSMMLLGSGLLGLAAIARRRLRKA